LIPTLPQIQIEVSNDDPASVGTRTAIVRITTRVPIEIFDDAPTTTYALREIGKALLDS
jgi:hypothetical protein